MRQRASTTLLPDMGLFPEIAPTPKATRPRKPPAQIPIPARRVKPPFWFLSLDQSSSLTGVCRVTVDSVGRPDYLITRFDLRKVIGEEAKLEAWDAYIKEQLADGPAAVLIERPIVPGGKGPHGRGGGIGSSIVLHQIAGIIKVAAAGRPGVLFREVAGARIKKWAGGEGVVDKQGAMLAARDRWGAQIKDDNTSDAAWLAHIGYHWLMGLDPVIRRRQEVLHEIAKEAATVRDEKLQARRAKRERARKKAAVA